ncbi:hypothetical protein GCM10010347_26250 [Streptomyces cirratus]|uniref:Uncharacterized protein n=1 Tax=Streptomyces cirratus TaxID=68187 RepID=A0ABQ3ERI6_9ACTN|nr:hypothetical protein GCM10010347_26250 [Streptomyces cirratus]
MGGRGVGHVEGDAFDVCHVPHARCGAAAGASRKLPDVLPGRLPVAAVDGGGAGAKEKGQETALLATPKV